VNLVEVYVVSLETAKAGFDGVHDVPSRGPDVVAPRADAAISLGGENNVHDKFCVP
jgi:hypothetical protein